MNGDDTGRELSENVVADVRRGTLRLARRLRAERPAGALSANKVLVLAYLSRAVPSTPGVIAEAERQRPQSLTRVFTDLRREGFIDALALDRRTAARASWRSHPPGGTRSPPTWPAATHGSPERWTN